MTRLKEQLFQIGTQITPNRSHKDLQIAFTTSHQRLDLLPPLLHHGAGMLLLQHAEAELYQHYPTSAHFRVGYSVLLKSFTPTFLPTEGFVSLHSQGIPSESYLIFFHNGNLQLSHSSLPSNDVISALISLCCFLHLKAPFGSLSAKVFTFFNITTDYDQDKCGSGSRKRLSIGQTLDILLHQCNTVKNGY